MPIYEGTSQIQALMAMKDTLGGIIKKPAGASCRASAQARWRALSARDALERRVARLQALSLSAQQHLITRTAADKLRDARRRADRGSGARRSSSNWNPKRDFALAMLHAERLTRLLADEEIAEILLEQARRIPERRDAARALARARRAARPRLHDEITTTGDRLLATLAPALAPRSRAAGG